MPVNAAVLFTAQKSLAAKRLLLRLLARGPEKERSEGGQGERQRVRVLVTGYVLGICTAQIAFATSPIMIAVAVQKLFPAPFDGNPNAKIAVDSCAEIVDE